MNPIYKIAGTKHKPTLSAETSQALPPGMYTVHVSMEEGIFFDKMTPVTDEIISIANSVNDKIIEDINNFLKPEVRQRFSDHKLVYKRGILLHGPPGTGKTTSIASVSKTIVDSGGIVLFGPSPDLAGEVIRMIRGTNPNSTILLIYEELETYLQRYSHEMLSILDGQLQVDNIVTLATTNYISRVPARIKNRPSRFAFSIEVGVPDAEFRKQFFSKKLLPQYQDRLVEFVDSTDGFVVDQMKDVIVSVCCIGVTLDETIRRLTAMQAESVGMDDYNEQEMKDYFALGKKEKNKPFRLT